MAALRQVDRLLWDDVGRKRPLERRPLSWSARIYRCAWDPWTGATSAYSKLADSCDSYVPSAVVLRRRINPSEGKTPGISRKYYWGFRANRYLARLSEP